MLKLAGLFKFDSWQFALRKRALWRRSSRHLIAGAGARLYPCHMCVACRPAADAARVWQAVKHAP